VAVNAKEASCFIACKYEGTTGVVGGVGWGVGLGVGSTMTNFGGRSKMFWGTTGEHE